MVSLARKGVSGAVLALSLAWLPAAARCQTTNVTITTYETGMAPIYKGRARAANMIHEMKLSSRQIVRVLPLLYDLRDAKLREQAAMSGVASDLVTDYYHGKHSASERIDSIENGYKNREAKIWNRISDRLGGDNGRIMQEMVEGIPDDSMAMAESDHIARIDALIKEWDSRRTTATASVDGTTVTATVTPGSADTQVNVQVNNRPGFAHRTGMEADIPTIGLVGVDDLIDLLETRLLSHWSWNDPGFMIRDWHEGVEGENMKEAWDRRMWMWK